MSSDRYLKAFKPDELIITPYLERGVYKVVNDILVETSADDPDLGTIRMPESRAEGTFEIIFSDIQFSISLPVEGDIVPSKYIKIAKKFLVKLDDLNAIAREKWSDGCDYKESLTSVEIFEWEVCFNYVAGTENAGWSASFIIGNDGELVFDSWG